VRAKQAHGNDHQFSLPLAVVRFGEAKLSESFVFGRVGAFFFLEFGIDEMDKHTKFDM
jgi:hypothetical protein